MSSICSFYPFYLMHLKSVFLDYYFIWDMINCQLLSTSVEVKSPSSFLFVWEKEGGVNKGLGCLEGSYTPFGYIGLHQH